MVITWGTVISARRVGEFVADACEVGVHEVGCTELYEAYRAWCAGRGIWVSSAPLFSRGLRVTLPDMGCYRPIGADKKRRRMYTGVRLRRIVAPEAAE